LWSHAVTTQGSLNNFPKSLFFFFFSHTLILKLDRRSQC